MANGTTSSPQAGTDDASPPSRGADVGTTSPASSPAADRPGSRGGPDRGSVRVRDSLAVRIAALVLGVLVATFLWGFVTLRQLRDMQAGFDRLVQVYSVFDKRLAEAHVQAVRIGEQVRTHQRRDERTPVDAGLRATLDVALQTRAAMIVAAREPIDEALGDPERFGGAEELAELSKIQESLGELETLVATPTEIDAVLADVRTQGQIEQLFEALRAQSGRAIEELRDEVQTARERAERWTLGLASATLVIGALAMLGVFLTLRPLRRLASSVRRLGRGDWSQRVLAEHARRGDEVGRLAQEFNLMAEALEERERRLLRGERLAAAGQLAAQITHEIRNPLSAVALNAGLLEDELEESSEGRRLLGKIVGEVDRLTNITEGYLHFARRPKPELVVIDLAAELRGWLEFSGPELEQENVTLTTSLPNEPVMVMGDANQLRQALLNLLRNAKEAALGEGPAAARARAPQIGVELRCKDAVVTMVVSDNGGGITLPADELDRIFEPFYTRKARGTGLGLPMVQQIAIDHGGAVRVGQTGPEGTRFELELPACATSEPALSSLPSHSFPGLRER